MLEQKRYKREVQNAQPPAVARGVPRTSPFLYTEIGRNRLVRFSLQDVKKQVKRRGGELYISLHFLGTGELQAEIERLVAYYERLLGKPQRQFSQEEARACIGDYRLAHCLIATLSAWYTWRQNDWAETIQQLPQPTEIQAHLASVGIASPAQLRLALFDYVNEHYQGFLEEKKRQHALQNFAASNRLSDSALAHLLALDSDDEAVLARDTAHPPGAGEVARLYNQWVFEVALSNASNVRFVIDCNAFSRVQQEQAAGRNVIGTGMGAVIKRLCYLARRLGVYYDLAYASTLPAAYTIWPTGDNRCSAAVWSASCPPLSYAPGLWRCSPAGLRGAGTW